MEEDKNRSHACMCVRTSPCMISASIHNVLFIIPQLFLPPAHPVWFSPRLNCFPVPMYNSSPSDDTSVPQQVPGLHRDGFPYPTRLHYIVQMCLDCRQKKAAANQPGLNSRHKVSARSSLLRSGIWKALLHVFCWTTDWSWSNMHLSVDNFTFSG